MLLQFSIPLFTGMVAATFIPPVRKVIPRPLEILLWGAFVTACVVGVLSVNDANAHEMTNSVIWGAGQIVSVMVGLMFGGVAGWLSDHRFVIGTGLVIVAGTDIFALMLVGSHRSAQPWQPRVRLGEWMEFPIPVSEHTLSHRQLETDPLMVLDRRLRTWTALAAFAAFAKSIEISLWVRDVMVPRETQRLARATGAARVGSRAGLQSLRDAGEHLRYAIWSWFVAAGEPLLEGLAARTARASGRAVKSFARLSAGSLSWYGPLSAEPTMAPGGEEATESQRSDRLAS